MSASPYRLHGTTPPRCLGRAVELTKIDEALRADDPANVSLFGPKDIGKSVVLQELIRRYARPADGSHNPDSPFDGVAHWDLRRQRVTNRATFYETLSATLAEAVAPVNSEAGGLLWGTTTWDTIRLALEDLAGKGQRVLIVLDNFDALMRADIESDEWDRLKHLHTRIGSVYYLIASRASLYDLCSVNQKAWELSDLPRIFPNPVRLNHLSAEDTRAFYEPFEGRGITFAPGALNEMEAWTGRVPALSALACRELWDRTQDGGGVTHTDVQAAISRLGEEPDLGQTLDALWRDCSDDGRQALAALAQQANGKLPVGAGVSPLVADDLTRRGYTEKKGSQLESACRLIRDHARAHGESATALHQLFGTPEGYAENMPRALRLWLPRVDAGRLNTLDQQLYRRAEHVLKQVDEPDIMLGQVRSFTNCALLAVMRAEIPSGVIEDSWVDSWRTRKPWRPEGPPPRIFSGPVPEDGGQQIALLRDMTDSRYGITTRVSRASFVLLAHLNEAGNLGQHLSVDLWPTFAHTTALAVIALCDGLAAELAPVPPSA